MVREGLPISHGFPGWKGCGVYSSRFFPSLMMSSITVNISFCPQVIRIWDDISVHRRSFDP
jgi:hypothetical protein